MKIVQYKALLLLLAITAWQSATSETPSRLLEEGIAAFNRSDPIAAMAAFRRAASEGDAEASVWLGWILDQAEENEKAHFWYSVAADSGNPAGTARLAEMYAKGEFVEQDFLRAVELFETSARAGYRKAMLVLAAAYERGGLGLDADPDRAELWQNRAAAADPAVGGRVP